LFTHKTFIIHCGHTLLKKSPLVQIIGASNTMASSNVMKGIIAVCQMTATNNKEDNVGTCSELIKSAKEKNCMVCHNCCLICVFCLQLLLCRLYCVLLQFE
jgi:endonuclease IV